jgi:hypothetical protein
MKNYEIGFEQLGVDLDKLNSTGYTICPECSHQRKQGNRNSKVLKVYLKTGYYDCKHCDFNGRVDSNEWIQEKHGIETGLITKPTKQTITQNNTSIKPFILAPLIGIRIPTK